MGYICSRGLSVFAWACFKIAFNRYLQAATADMTVMINQLKLIHVNHCFAKVIGYLIGYLRYNIVVTSALLLGCMNVSLTILID